MKNKNNTTENLIEHHPNGQIGYEHYTKSNGFSSISTYDKRGNELTYSNSNEFSYQRTYDEQMRVLTHSDSKGVSKFYTYDEKNQVTEHTNPQATLTINTNKDHIVDTNEKIRKTNTMKKLLTKIASWFRSVPQRSTQDEINFDLEKFDIRFCKKCGDPFQPINPVNKYCSKVCRVRFNNNKRK